jgi:hypothetical protein
MATGCKLPEPSDGTWREPAGGANFLPEPPESASGKYRLLPMLGRLLPKAKPTYPPEELFKMPKYSEKVVAPAFAKVAFNEAKNSVKNIKDKANDIGNEIQYKCSSLYDALVNEAANRHLSKDKR